MKFLSNTEALELDFEWLSWVIQSRFSIYFNQGSEIGSIYEQDPPQLELPLSEEPDEIVETAAISEEAASVEEAADVTVAKEVYRPDNYAVFVSSIGRRLRGWGAVEEKEKRKALTSAEILQLDREEKEVRLLILLALAPHLRPELLDLFFTKNTLYDRGYTVFGGLVGQEHSGFLPTGETVLFLLAGHDLNARLRVRLLFNEDHFLYQENLIQLHGTRVNEPRMSGALIISDEYLTNFTTGKPYEPIYSTKFPAKKLTTKLDWEKDFVIAPYQRDEIDEIFDWIIHEDKIMKEWGMDRILKPGYRALFYGPPGTGKTLCVTLLGKRTERPVYRIDLSQVVSKYIGETEKNLASIFDRAESRKWILFFDEADALFGKRSATKDAKDRYANQEIAYLLQRIESFDGLIILATNLKGNIDEAFARRFQSMIYFPMPNAEQRLELWQKVFPPAIKLDTDINLEEIAEEFELSGGAMINVARYCSLAALRHEKNKVSFGDLMYGIRKEFRKEGKTV